MKGLFDNSLRLVRFTFKRERAVTTVWLAVLFIGSIIFPITMNDMFKTPEDMFVMAETMRNPAVVAMVGPLYSGAEGYTLGAVYANEMLLFTAICAAVMNIFLVVRHTRADEERGRYEVVRSLPVGRLANLNAVLISAVVINVILSLSCGAVMGALGFEGMDFPGSLLFGAILGTTGLFFAAVAALFSQLSANSRGALGYSFAALGIMYMMRAVGDISSEPLALASPLGLILRTKVYVENSFLPLLALLILTALTAAAALCLNSVRDVDRGFIAARPGRDKAARALLSPFGITFRLVRNVFFVWIGVLFLFGATYGSIMGDMEKFVAENEFFRMMIPDSPDHSINELVITMLNTILALCAAVPVIIITTKLRTEERELRAEHILARAVSRTRYILTYAVIAFFAGLFCLLAAAAGLYSASSAVMNDPIPLSSMLKSIIVYLPALLATEGIALLLVGLIPRAVSLSWAYFGYSFFAVYLGRMVNLPEWAVKLTPFGHIPQLPVDKFEPAVIAVVTLLSAGLITAGILAYKSRSTCA